VSSAGTQARSFQRSAWPAGRAGGAAGWHADVIQPPWADEIRLMLTALGAVTIVFLPAALAVVETPTLAFVEFSLAVTVDWTACIFLQVVILRLMRRRPPQSRLPLIVQFLVVAAVSVAVKLLSDVFVGPYTERAGMGGSEDWRFAVASWTSVLVGLYMVVEREGRSRHALAARRLAEVQRAQVRARREVVDGQLRAMQARVDPQFFFDTLDAIEALYLHDVVRAEALFDELVVFLRAALPHVDASSSVLAREIALAESCTRVDALARGHPRQFRAEVPPELMRLPFPAGVLLPLLQGALVATGDPAEVDVSLRAELVGDGEGAGSAMRLVVSAPHLPPAATFERVEASLRALFGDAAALRVVPAPSDRFEIIVSLPHDPS